MAGDGKVYTANQDDNFDGVGPVKAGQTFTGLDAETARILKERGIITEGKVAAGGTQSSEHGIALADPADMGRGDLLSELGRDATDDLLRDGVRACRAQRDEQRGAAAKPTEKPDPLADLSEEDAAEAKKLMRSSEAKLRELAADEKVEGLTADHEKADIVAAILAKRRDKPAEEPFDAAAFVGRTLDDISADELAGLSDENRAAVRTAEGARDGGARAGLIERLDALDKPADA
jgi:hypothetical protein